MSRAAPTVSDYFSEKTIFVTGATGFIGKVLVWKLLRSCSSVDTIYLLLRPKRAEDVEKRLEKLFETPIFDDIKKDNPRVLSKVKAVAGDVAAHNLGLSEDDERRLTDSVHVIFHVAATVNFKVNLRDAINVNLEGTRRLLDLATRMPKLQAFVHTSTAFCCCDISELGQKPYGTKETPRQIRDMVHWMRPDLLESITDEIIKPHPNTYTYSKRLAENLVAEYFPKLPVTIARPSIVMPGQWEPIPGWVDNVNGCMGMMVGGAKGVWVALWVNGKCHPEMMTVDVVCNNLIAQAWKIGKDEQKPEHLPTYNLGRTEVRRFSYDRLKEVFDKWKHAYPFSVALGYPWFVYLDNFYAFTACAIIFQWVPAVIIDAILFVLGRERMSSEGSKARASDRLAWKSIGTRENDYSLDPLISKIMIRVQRKIKDAAQVLSYFTRREWNFVKTNVLQLKNELSEEDRKIFKLTNKDIDLEEYFISMMKVARWYMMKDDMANLPTARRTYKIFWLVHHLGKFGLVLLVAWIFLSRLFHFLA